MCDCIKKIDAALAQEGRELVLSWPLDKDLNVLEPRVMVATIYTESRRKGKNVSVPYCPMCGYKYANAVAARTPTTQRQGAA